MARIGGAGNPRWNRAFIVTAFAASAVVGAAFGLEARVEPVAIASGTNSVAVPLLQTSRNVNAAAARQFFVAAQPIAVTPYGAPISLPHLGVPAVIELPAQPMLSCDLIAHTISQTVFVFDAEGEPVVGANVVFTVNRSDVDEPQLVSDTTGFDGAAHVSVRVPDGLAPNGLVPSYSILAEAFETHSTTPAVSERFSIHQYTCTGAAGVR